ncbi:hypothetical protein K438DRAFT_1936931 [Mycena galopus ATCC 62051]|nr:hypothetical protein K438DRAFT_1936931 [Mycena galopus ATCC 62051]
MSLAHMAQSDSVWLMWLVWLPHPPDGPHGVRISNIPFLNVGAIFLVQTCLKKMTFDFDGTSSVSPAISLPLTSPLKALKQPQARKRDGLVRCKSPRGLDIAKTKTRSQADGLSIGSALTQDLLVRCKAASRPQIQGLGIVLCHPPDFLAITLPGVYLVLWRVLSQNLQRAKLLQVFDIAVHVHSLVTSSGLVQSDNEVKGRESVEYKKMNGRSSGVCLSLPFVLPLTCYVFFWVPSLRYTAAPSLRNRVTVFPRRHAGFHRTL